MNIVLNGKPRDVAENVTLAELLDQLAIDMQEVAIERNLQVVMKQDYKETALAEGDTVEIVRFVGGG